MSSSLFAFATTPQQLPTDLVGRWTDGTSLYEFATNGSYFWGSAAQVPYSISSCGNELSLDGSTFPRANNSGSTIEGLWLNASGIEWRFRSDGSYTAHDGSTYQGLYDADGSQMIRLEKRAFVIANGNLLTFQPLWSPWQPAAYLRSNDELTIFLASSRYVWQ